MNTITLSHNPAISQSTEFYQVWKAILDMLVSPLEYGTNKEIL